MTKLRNLFLALPVLFLVTVAVYASSGKATDIPSSIANNDKTLWRQVMATVYGSYDKKQKCWVSTADDTSYCMRPLTIHRVSDGATRYIFLAVAGNILGKKRGCHSCGGMMGLLLLRETTKALQLVARSDPYFEIGTFGVAPGKGAISVHRIGKPAVFAWTIESTWDGMGLKTATMNIFAVSGNKVEAVGELPRYFDDQANCKNGVNWATKEKCSKLRVSFAYEAASTDETFMPIRLDSAGTLRGKPLTSSLISHFDRKTMRYAIPQELLAATP